MTYTKAQWRDRLLRARRSIDADARRDASAAVVARIAALAEFRRARALLLYVALGAEVDPHALALHAWRDGKQVFVPAGDTAPRGWTAIGQTRAGAAHDGACDVVTPPAPVLLVAPGVGFDAHGVRLGRGRGYYDRAIATLRAATDVVVVGAAYDLQVVDALPRDPWDQSVDLVVTERRLVARAGAAGQAARAGHDVQEEPR